MNSEAAYDSSNKNDYSQPLKNKKETVICKDGFCSLPNQNEVTRIDKDDMNLFDPI